MVVVVDLMIVVVVDSMIVVVQDMNALLLVA